MASESFTFLSIYMEDAGDMTAEEKGEYLEAVINYGLTGAESEHKSSAVRIAFRHAKKLIDAASAKKGAAQKSASARWDKDEDADVMRDSCEADARAMRSVCDTDAKLCEGDAKPMRIDAKPMRDACESMQSKSKSKSKRENKSISKTENKSNNISISESLSLTPSLSGDSGDSDGERERKSDFDVFWDAYPRKEAQSAALKAWADAVEAGDIRFGDGAVIASAVERSKQTSQWQQEDGRFIPMPARYLSERRWRDQPAEIPGAGSFKPDEFFELALKKSYEGMDERGTA